MAKHLGIDVGSSSVRAVLVRSSYRRMAVEAMGECDLASVPTLVDAIRAAAGPLAAQGESVAVSVDGERIFVRVIEVPETAAKQLAELLPFELEAQLPVEFGDVVYDHKVLRSAGSDGPIRVLAAAARIDDVRARIDLVKEAIGLEPERVGCGGFPLANLASVMPELAVPGPIAVLDIESERSELMVLLGADPVFTRTLSRGTAGLPASAPALARELRQTLGAWRAAGGAPVEIVYLAGPGAAASGAEAFLEAELGVPVVPIPAPRVEMLTPEQEATLPRFAKALGLALGLASRSRAFNLRRGVLTYERGYGFLREKIPILSGLAVVIAVSFAFAIGAEWTALGDERAMLESALTTLSREVLGEETKDAARAMEMLEKPGGGADEDPLPHADGFDVMVQLAQAVPDTMTHDVEELDVQRTHVTLHGIVPTIPDAQQIANTLKGFRCFQDVKIVRTNQVVGEDRQKYVLELDIKCPNEKDKDKDKDKAAAPAGGAAPAGSGEGVRQ